MANWPENCYFAGMDRRNILKTGLATIAATALPVRAFAAVNTLTPYEMRVMNVAAQQKERHISKLWRTDIVGIADFGLPSWKPRMHFVNLENGSIRSFLTAHGKGSDPEHDGWLNEFSNVSGSEATSRGAYLTAEEYHGRHGRSLRLDGLDPTNANARRRAIVIHSAAYAEPDMIDAHGKLGRSNGCIAFSKQDLDAFLADVPAGTLIYVGR